MESDLNPNCKKVSVIMPVYKAGKTLERAIDSVLAQDYPDIEILTVLNGEEDDSLCSSICERYEKENASSSKRIRVFRNTEKGVSAARNTGIENAKGEYIAFLDSDDIMLPRALGMMVSRIEKDNSDMVIAGFERSDKPKDAPRLPYADMVIDVPGNAGDMKRLYIEDFLNMPWNKLYKREYIKDAFPTALSLGEDLCFNLSYIPRTGRISLFRYPVCRYMVDDQASSLSAKKRSDRIFVAMRLYRRANAFFEELYPDTGSCYEVTRTKVMTTFLDELCLLGMADISDKEGSHKEGVSYTKDEYNRTVKKYVRAIRRFRKQRSNDIKVKAPDHKMIYLAASAGQIWAVKLLIRQRAVIVRLRNSLSSKKNEGQM